MSSEDGLSQIWQRNTDGSAPLQLTFAEHPITPSGLRTSPDPFTAASAKQSVLLFSWCPRAEQVTDVNPRSISHVAGWRQIAF